MVPAEHAQIARIEERINNLENWQEKQDKCINVIQCDIKKIHLQLQAQTVKLAFIVGISQVLLAAYLTQYFR